MKLITSKYFLLFSLLACVLLVLSSCSKLFTIGLGIHQPKHLSEKKLNAWKHEFQIPDSISFTLNDSLFTARFYEFKNRADYDKIRGDVNDYYQPLKAIYIDNDKDSIIACVFNCLADLDGFNLTWNRNGEMSQFPPRFQEFISRVIPVNYHFDIINQHENVKAIIKQTQKKYCVLLFWSAFEGRQTKRFINQVRDNITQFVSDSCQIVYINADEFYAKHINDKD